MEHSETIGKLATALVKVQAELKPAPMNKVNKFLGNNYADLGTIIQTAMPVLTRHGLAVSQLPASDNGRMGIITVLMHESGEWLAQTATMDMVDEKGKSAAQVAGSIISYLRRYALAAAIGIYSDEDTDGNGATRDETVLATAKAAQPAKPAAKPAPHWSEDDQVRKAFWADAKRRGYNNTEVHARLQVPHLADYPGSREQALAALPVKATAAAVQS